MADCVVFSPRREVGTKGDVVTNDYTAAEDQGRYFGGCTAKVSLINYVKAKRVEEGHAKFDTFMTWEKKNFT